MAGDKRLAVHLRAHKAGQRLTFVSNQQKWASVEGERSGVIWRFGELPDGPVVASSPFDRLSLHLLLTLQDLLSPCLEDV